METIAPRSTIREATRETGWIWSINRRITYGWANRIAISAGRAIGASDGARAFTNDKRKRATKLPKTATTLSWSGSRCRR